MSSSSKRQIATLNDSFRTTFVGGTIILTRGIADLPEDTRLQVLADVQSFDGFTADNDPHREHDFGSFELKGTGRVIWKIDYYDLDLKFGSEDPADQAITKRVLTIMLATEY